MKKLFNWVGFLWISLFVCGLIALVLSTIWCVVFPKSTFVLGFWGDATQGLGTTIILGAIYLLLGLILVPAFYKKSVREINAKRAFETAPTYTAIVRAVSKTSQVVGNKYSTGTIYHVAFAFSNGNRKSFIVNAKQYNVFVENESGVLTYKQQGEYLFFISFNPQN